MSVSLEFHLKEEILLSRWKVLIYKEWFPQCYVTTFHYVPNSIMLCRGFINTSNHLRSYHRTLCKNKCMVGINSENSIVYLFAHVAIICLFIERKISGLLSIAIKLVLAVGPDHRNNTL